MKSRHIIDLINVLEDFYPKVTKSIRFKITSKSSFFSQSIVTTTQSIVCFLSLFKHPTFQTKQTYHNSLVFYIQVS